MDSEKQRCDVYTLLKVLVAEQGKSQELLLLPCS